MGSYLNPCVRLLGVQIVGKIKEVNGGKGTRLSFKFMTPYSDKPFSTKDYRSRLKDLGKTISDLILDINNLTWDDVPCCPVCKSRKVRVGTRTGEFGSKNLLNPVIGQTCRDPSCSFSFGQHRRIERLGPEEFGKLQSEVNRKRLINNTHPSQTHGHFYEIINGNKLHFNSKAEIRVFKKYYYFLNKYYLRERTVGSYISDDGSEKIYSADYVLKPEFRNSKLPYIIEVKSGNLIRCGRYDGLKAGVNNYSKFKMMIDQGKSVYVIDNRKDKQTIHKIRSINDLNNLFNEVING